MQPLVSILIPTYEPNPAFLKEAIDSAIAQTETRWTMLIHDDCSTADVESMVKDYQKDPRITFTRSPVRLGIGGNWNACLKMCHGEPVEPRPPFIQFLFQDDIWKPTYLAHMITALEENPSAGFASGGHIYACDISHEIEKLYQDVHRTREYFKTGLHDGSTLLKDWITQELHPNIIGEPSFVMLRRSLVDSVGPFAEDMPQFLDVEYWTRCLLKADWVWVKGNLGSFRVHEAGASAQNQVSGAGIYDRLRCFEQIIHSLPSSDLKIAAIKARNKALDGMAKKFLHRLRGKKKIPTQGSSGMWKFAMRHPVLMMRSLLRAIFSL